MVPITLSLTPLGIQGKREVSNGIQYSWLSLLGIQSREKFHSKETKWSPITLSLTPLGIQGKREVSNSLQYSSLSPLEDGESYKRGGARSTELSTKLGERHGRERTEAGTEKRVMESKQNKKRDSHFIRSTNTWCSSIMIIQGLTLFERLWTWNILAERF
ncbi:hypothetical protein TNCV_1784911 [Trichonephila clavipes]|nr:hypothetical protein TNCV_1784911 [Trichonephila clavipes]